jgi:endonuclease YncB( thermonuclease family)
MYINYKGILIALVLALLPTGQLYAATFSGKLVRVFAGDRVEVQHGGKFESVRLAQIYAPVEGQPYGIVAKNFIWRMAGNAIVTVQFENYDLYGSAIGEVFLSDSRNLNKLIVEAGYAWRYADYSEDAEYAELAAGARKARRGLWIAENPVPPWEWRWLQNKAASAIKSGGTDFICGSKQNCSEMTSCEEAKFYLYACGLTRLDRDGNGVPCEPKCK